MELRRLLHLLRQRLLLIVLIVIAALAAGYVSTSRVSRYTSSATLLVNQQAASAEAAISANFQAGLQFIAFTDSQMVATPDVVKPAIIASGVPRSTGQVVGEVSSTVVAGTSLLKITVTDPDPVVAQTLANAIAKQFVARIGAVSPVVLANGRSAPPVAISQAALLPVAPNPLGTTRNLILGGIFGLVGSIALVLLLDYVDLTVRSPDDIEHRLGLPVLGVIPMRSDLRPNEQSSMTRPLAAAGAGR